jgi:hypothetical protein
MTWDLWAPVLVGVNEYSNIIIINSNIHDEI